MVSKRDETQIQQHFLIIRKMILEVGCYRNYRGEFEEDKSTDCIFIAEANLKAAERVLQEGNNHER